MYKQYAPHVQFLLQPLIHYNSPAILVPVHLAFLKSSILLSVNVPNSALTTFVNHASFVINIQMIKHKMLLHIIDNFCLFFICPTPFSRIFYPSIRVSHSNIPFYRFYYLTLQNCNKNQRSTCLGFYCSLFEGKKFNTKKTQRFLPMPTNSLLLHRMHIMHRLKSF